MSLDPNDLEYNLNALIPTKDGGVQIICEDGTLRSWFPPKETNPHWQAQKSLLVRAEAELAELKTLTAAPGGDQPPAAAQGISLRFKPYKKGDSNSGPSETEVIELAYALLAKGDLITDQGDRPSVEQVLKAFGVQNPNWSTKLSESQRKTGPMYPQKLNEALKTKYADLEKDRKIHSKA